MLTECKICKATVDAKVHAHYDGYDEEMLVPERYSFAECPRCHSPFILFQNYWGDQWDSPGRLYPPSDDLVGWTIPTPIRNAFTEAVRCINAKIFTASMIMCRKTLEGVCDDHQAAGKTLKDRLESLKNKGVIEGRLFEWADELRLVGNRATHNVDVEVTPQDAADAVEFARALLEYTYTFRHRFDEFKNRRKQAEATKKPLTS